MVGTSQQFRRRTYVTTACYHRIKIGTILRFVQLYLRRQMICSYLSCRSVSNIYT